MFCGCQIDGDGLGVGNEGWRPAQPAVERI